MLSGNLNRAQVVELKRAEALLETSEPDRRAALESTIDCIIAPDCPLCGGVMLESACFSGFVDPVLDQEELEKWAI